MSDHMHNNECVRHGPNGCCEAERIRAAHRQCPKYKATGHIECKDCNATKGRKFGQQVFASSTGSIMTSTLLSPFDVIKVRQQALGRPFLGTVRNVMTNEGVAALWRGLVPGLAMAIPASTVYLALYEVIRDRVAPMAWHEHSAAAIAPPVAGFTARAFTATFVSPLELVRTKMQASVTSKASQLTMTQGFRHIVQAEGWRGMFRGLGASIARDAPFSAVYWTTFEAGKRALAGSGHPLLTDDTSTPGNPKPTIASTLIAAASGGALSAFVTNPMDVVKTQLQTLPVKPDAPPPPSVRQQFWAILESQGVRGFYNGFAVRVARIVPATALFMASYDVLRNLQW